MIQSISLIFLTAASLGLLTSERSICYRILSVFLSSCYLSACIFTVVELGNSEFGSKLAATLRLVSWISSKIVLPNGLVANANNQHGIDWMR